MLLANGGAVMTLPLHSSCNDLVHSMRASYFTEQVRSTGTKARTKARLSSISHARVTDRDLNPVTGFEPRLLVEALL